MLYARMRGYTHIYAQPGENDMEIIKSIVRASLETAPAVGANGYFVDRRALYPADVEQLAQVVFERGSLRMDIVRGRICATHIYRKNIGHFVLDDRRFRTYRQEPLEEMLKSAGAQSREEIWAPMREAAEHN